MKKCWMFSVLFVTTSLGFSANSVMAIRLDLAKVQVAQLEAYLEERPGAQDELDAVNLLLSGYQILGDFNNVVKYLEQRYVLLSKGDLKALTAKKLDMLMNRTALPLLELYYREFKYDKAAEAADRFLKDFEGHPVGEKLKPTLEALAARYRMPAVGDSPVARFTDFTTGAEVSVEQYRGRYVFMEFWVTNCDICKTQKGFLHEAWELFHEEGFEILAFSQDGDKKVLRSFLEEHPVPWHQCFDQDLAHQNSTALKVRVVPYSMLLDREGVVVAVNLRGEELLTFLYEAFPSVKRVE